MKQQDKGKKYPREEALAKLQSFCAYQDRCHREVRSKLLSLGVYGEVLEEIITKLIEDNFLNEERFARSFCRGKFKFKSWGKYRLEQELQKRDISAYCIRKGLEEIDEKDYRRRCLKLFEKYWEKQKGSAPVKEEKTFRHLMQKGYEIELIRNCFEIFKTRKTKTKDL